MKELVKNEKSVFLKVLNNQSGRIGYLIAWMLGVPASLLFIIFLIRGG